LKRQAAGVASALQRIDGQIAKAIYRFLLGCLEIVELDAFISRMGSELGCRIWKKYLGILLLNDKHPRMPMRFSVRFDKLRQPFRHQLALD